MTPVTPLSFPSDLWEQYESMCSSRGAKAIPTLRLHVKDYLDHPNELANAVLAALSRPRAESASVVTKAGRWPADLLGDASTLAQRLHISRDALLRLIVEGVVANTTTRQTKTSL